METVVSCPPSRAKQIINRLKKHVDRSMINGVGDFVQCTYADGELSIKYNEIIPILSVDCCINKRWIAYVYANKYTYYSDFGKGYTEKSAIAALKRKIGKDSKDLHFWAKLS